MEIARKTKGVLKNLVLETVLASVLVLGGCGGPKARKPIIGQDNIAVYAGNVVTYTGHASREILTDTDYDAKFDFCERIVGGSGGFHKLYVKKGYGFARDPGMEVEFVGPEFFESYNRNTKWRIK